MRSIKCINLCPEWWKKGENQITGIRNQRGDITIDSVGIKIIF